MNGRFYTDEEIADIKREAADEEYDRECLTIPARVETARVVVHKIARLVCHLFNHIDLADHFDAPGRLGIDVARKTACDAQWQIHEELLPELDAIARLAREAEKAKTSPTPVPASAPISTTQPKSTQRKVRRAA